MQTTEPPNDAEDPKTEGGSGVPCAPNTRDIRLTALALAESWPASPEARAAMVRQLESVVSEEGMIRKKPRAFHAAAKALTALSRINLSIVAAAISAREHEEVLARLEELERQVEREGRDR